MLWIQRIIGLIATILFFLLEFVPLAIISLIVLIIEWASGSLALMRTLNVLKSGLVSSKKEAADFISDRLALVNMITMVVSIVFLIISLFMFF